MQLTTYIPKPKFIVGVVISLALIVLILKAGGANQYVASAKSSLGLTA